MRFISKSEFKELYNFLYAYHIYSNIPINRCPTQLEKKVADMTVRCFLEDREIKSKAAK